VIRVGEYSGAELHGELLAHAWLAEPLSLDDVGEVVGAVSATALQRIRDVELIALGAVESHAHAGDRGGTPYVRAANDEAHAVRTLHRVWRDNLELTGMVQSGLAHVGRIAVKGAAMALRRLYQGFTSTGSSADSLAGQSTPPTSTAEQEMSSTKEHSQFAHAA
jgi:hypothetical protein